MAYLTIFRIRLLASLQYRAAALAQLAPRLFVGMVQAMFFTAFYAGAPGDQPMTLAQAVTYCWLIQLLVHVQPWSGDPETLQTIRTGNIAYELCRPLDLYSQWFWRMAARKVVPLVMITLPLWLVVLFLLPERYRMAPPASPAAFATFLLALAGAILMGSALANILGILTIWTISGEGLYYLVPVIFMLLSGILAPLPFFPPALQQVINFLPFRGLLDTPAQSYLGLLEPVRALPVIGTQLVWTAGFVLLGHRLLARALRSVMIQGG